MSYYKVVFKDIKTKKAWFHKWRFLNQFFSKKLKDVLGDSVTIYGCKKCGSTKTICKSDKQKEDLQKKFISEFLLDKEYKIHYNEIKFNDLLSKILKLEAGKKQVDVAQGSEFLSYTLKILSNEYTEEQVLKLLNKYNDPELGYRD